MSEKAFQGVIDSLEGCSSLRSDNSEKREKA
jgi:hypothetical protein